MQVDYFSMRSYHSDDRAPQNSQRLSMLFNGFRRDMRGKPILVVVVYNVDGP